MSSGKTLIVIPARMGGKRLPDKPLRVIAGQTLLERTWRKAIQIPDSEVYIATDSYDVVELAMNLGASVVKTPEFNCGTERVHYVLTRHIKTRWTSFSVVVNLQVDEPDIDPEDLNRLIATVRSTECGVCTITRPLQEDERHNPNVVKAVCSTGQCHWFLRKYFDGARAHIGVYAFEVHYLLNVLGSFPYMQISKYHRLEQLSWICCGSEIFCIETTNCPISINVEQDVARLEERLKCDSAS